MRALRIAILVLMMFSLNMACSAQSKPEKAGKSAAETEQVTVYYFHLNARCATCKAIESETQSGLKELFGDKVAFKTFNLDKDSGEAKGKQLDVSGQTLLIVKGDKKINITNEAFLYARNNPVKFKQVIEDKIKPLL